MDQHSALLETSGRPSALRRVMCAVPGLRWLYHEGRRLGFFHDPEFAPFLTVYDPGHYYNPIPRMSDAVAAWNKVRGRAEVPGVDMRDDAQLALLDAFAPMAASIPFGPAGADTGCRYHYGNTWFDECDAAVLHCMLRHLRPPRVLEVGSGYSSAVSLDTSERFLDASISFTFIEPNPYRLNAMLRDQDRSRHTVINRPVWDVPMETLTSLRAGDVFFIDTSHVVKAGSDVQFLLLEVMPRLAPGVIIHLHDIFWPFEYPGEWFRMGRAYNEAYLLQGMLAYSRGYEVLFFNHYLQCRHEAALAAALPVAMRSLGSSLWLRKTA